MFMYVNVGEERKTELIADSSALLHVLRHALKVACIKMYGLSGGKEFRDKLFPAMSYQAI
jgi:hypothetical protein